VTGLYYTFFSPLFRMNKRKDTRGKGIFSKLTLADNLDTHEHLTLCLDDMVD